MKEGHSAPDLWHLTIDDLLTPPPETPRLGGAGPFVINLSASTAPITIPEGFAGLEQLRIYQVKRTENNRWRYRLRLGPINTELEADVILAVVRERYPSAFTATAGDDDLRATSAAARTALSKKVAPSELISDKPEEDAEPPRMAEKPAAPAKLAKKPAAPAAQAPPPVTRWVIVQAAEKTPPADKTSPRRKNEEPEVDPNAVTDQVAILKLPDEGLAAELTLDDVVPPPAAPKPKAEPEAKAEAAPQPLFVPTRMAPPTPVSVGDLQAIADLVVIDDEDSLAGVVEKNNTMVNSLESRVETPVPSSPPIAAPAATIVQPPADPPAALAVPVAILQPPVVPPAARAVTAAPIAQPPVTPPAAPAVPVATIVQPQVTPPIALADPVPEIDVPPTAIADLPVAIIDPPAPIAAAPVAVAESKPASRDPVPTLTDARPAMAKPTPVSDPAPVPRTQSPAPVAHSPKAMVKSAKAMAKVPRTVARTSKAIARQSKAVAKSAKAFPHSAKTTAHPVKSPAHPPKTVVHAPGTNGHAHGVHGQPPRVNGHSPNGHAPRLHGQVHRAESHAPSVKGASLPANGASRPVNRASPSVYAATPPANGHARETVARLPMIVAQAPAPMTDPAPPATPAARPIEILADPLPPMDSTQTIRALTPLELVDDGSSRWFAIQLSLSEDEINPESVPHLDIFDEYRLYSVAGIEQGKFMHALRLGFFTADGAAQAVAGYLKCFFDEPAVKRVSIAERKRFAEQRVVPRKDVGATGGHTIIELSTAPRVPETTLADLSQSAIRRMPGGDSLLSRLFSQFKK